MDLLSVRAFATELVKIALELQDADIRALLAERRGDKDYFPGGQLPSNAPVETNFVPKLASFAKMRDPEINPLSAVKPQKKSKDERYQQVRDTALTGIGGATFGNAIMRLGSNAMRNLRSHKPGVQWKDPSGRAHLISAVAGGGLALGDRYLRHRRNLPDTNAAGQGAQVTKLAFTTPGMELTRNRKVGLFENKLHVGAPRQAPGLLGRAGRIAVR